jgi:hypothetical protein
VIPVDEYESLEFYTFDQVRCQSTTRCLGLQFVEGPGDPGIFSVKGAATTDGGLHWSATNGPNVYARSALACTRLRCVSAGVDVPHANGLGNGPFATTTDLGAHWTNRLVSQVGEAQGLACADTTHCIQVAQNGTATSSDGGRTWTAVSGTGGTGLGGFDVACVSATHCFTLVDDNIECSGGKPLYCPPPPPEGPQSDLPLSEPPSFVDIQETTDGGKTYHVVWDWTQGRAYGIACPTATHCITVASLGPNLDWTPGRGWQISENDPHFSAAYSSNPLQCASATRCYAIDFQGNVWTTTNAGASWSKTPTQPTGVVATLVSCVDTTHCVVAGTTSAGVPRLARTANGGRSWTTIAAPAVDPYQALSCNAAAKCITATATSVFISSDGGTTWSASTSPTASGGTDARCRANFCVVVGPVTLRTP